MEQNQMTAVLPMITPGILEKIMKDRRMDIEQASKILYSSRLYGVLEQVETGLWRLSPLTLYSLLDEELTTGKITFPEEQ